jgi:hypothetical protein
MTTKLRAHHLLCMLTFAGKGYTTGFVDNFESIVHRIAGGEAIEIVNGPDDICAPFLTHPECHCHNTSVVERDRLAGAELSSRLRHTIVPGCTLSLGEEQLSSLRDAFAEGTIRSACKGCQWVPLCDSIAHNNFRDTRLVDLSSKRVNSGGC